MAEIIRMPKMSDTMEEGVIAAWLKKVGDTVKPGDILALTLFIVIMCMFFTPLWLLYTYSKEHR